MDDIFPNWAVLQHGCSINVVLQTLLVEKDGLVGRTLSMPSQKILVRGDMPSDFKSVVVIVNAKAIEVAPIPVIEVGLDTGFYSVPHCSSDRLRNVVELCSGIGAFSSVASQFNMRTLAGVDFNAKWKGMFGAMHNGAQFFEGDVADMRIITNLLSLDAFYSWVVAGVSCQPHSRGGDQKGMADERATSLHKVLHTAWLIQSPLIILECVAEVLKDAAVQTLLRQYCQATGCCLTQKVLKLTDVWPTARTRWYAILTSPLLGPIQIADLPGELKVSEVQDIMPFIRQWPSYEHDQLQLTLYELAKYYEFASGGIESQFIKMNGTIATCLHSAGNQVYHCRCGCRGPFTLARMAAKGLFATLVPLADSTYHLNQWMRHCRFLHPTEMMLLQGGDPKFQGDPDMRLCLAAIGQCVSPIHACWIFAHASNAILAFLREPLCDPLQKLRVHIDTILQSRDQIWKPQHVLQVAEQQMEVEVNDRCNDAPIRFKATTPTTVAMFQDAESKLHGVDSCMVIVTDSADHVLASDVALSNCQGLQLPNHQKPQPSFVCEVECPCHEWSINETMQDPDVSPTVPYVVQEPASQNQGVDLANLPINGLLSLQCPQMQSTQEVGHLLKQLVTSQARCEMLAHQNFVWADDEIRYFLEQVAQSGPTELALFVWDPLILSCVIRHGKFDLLKAYATWMPSAATILTGVSIEQHWYPIVWQWQNGSLTCFTCGHAGHFSMAVQSLHHAVCKVLGCEATLVQHYPIAFPVTECCGAMVVAFVEFVIFSKPLPPTLQVLIEKHRELRAQFGAQLPLQTPRPWIWGSGEHAWQTTLGVLLQEHGVSADEVASRIGTLTDKLGAGPLAKAVESPAPWRELKWLANSQVPALQLIRPAELQRSIDRKVQLGGVVGSRSQKKHAKGKAGGKGKSPPHHVDPSSLRIEHGLFECGEGIPLSQLDLAHVGQSSSGVILCTWAQAAPYLRSGKQISLGGLAMILVDTREGVDSCPLIAEPVRVPVICQANSEPALIDGVLYQLGAMPVRRRDNPDKFELITISSCVAKVMIFRDQVEGQWEQVVAHPLRYIFSRIPCLQACTDPDCKGSCEGWHSSESCQIADPILELWGKQYIRLNFQQTNPQDAEVFQVMMRLPQCMQVQIQTYSGISGIYLEPRGINGKQPSDLFQVVWVPKASFDELRMLKQTTAGVLGLARLGVKYGLRCSVDKASEVHNVVKPGSAYLPQGKKYQFLLGPVPFGTLKSSITQMIESIQWQGRAIQPVPAAAHVQGIMWKVQAISQPKQTLIHTANGDVLIPKLVDLPANRPQLPNIIAAKSTVTLCTDPAVNPQVDPLQLADPWASAVRQGHVANSKVPPQAEDPVEVLQKQVFDAVMAKLPQGMEVDGDPKAADSMRVASLEQKVNELASGQRQLHTMFVDQNQRHDAQVVQLQKHTAQLEVSMQEHSIQLGSFQQQFKAQLDQQQTHLDGLFGQQMARLEEMLGGCKKPRME